MKKTWFDEEFNQKREENVFLPRDLQSPLQNPITDTPNQHLHPGHQQGKRTRIIINKDMRIVREWSLARKGRQRETTNLTKFIFTSINRLLSSAQHFLHKLGHTEAEVEALRQFRRRRGELNSYDQLLRCKQIMEMVQAQFQSTRVVKDILESRMDFGNKLMAIRVLENIRRICYGRKRWKK